MGTAHQSLVSAAKEAAAESADDWNTLDSEELDIGEIEDEDVVDDSSQRIADDSGKKKKQKQTHYSSI